MRGGGEAGNLDSMPVQFISADVVRDRLKRILDARQEASEQLEGGISPERPEYWQRVFEKNAAAVLAALPRVRLKPDYVVRYRFYGRRGADLLVRPFVARETTDVETIRELIDWHPPPDSVAPSLRPRANRDVDLLYRHFEFEASAEGHFEYWLAMQELWASARWVHSTVIADADQLRDLTSSGDWEIDQTLERCEPAVVREDEVARLAVSVFCRLERQTIALHQVEIYPDQRIEFANAIPVARGPRGYLM